MTIIFDRKIYAISLIIGLLCSRNGDVIGTVSMPCPPQWAEWGQNCYYLGTNNVSFYDAVALCAAMASDVPNARLTTIHSQAENDFVYSLTSTIATPGIQLLIGMQRSQVDQQFYWIDNSPIVFINWAPGEPNNRTGPEDCVNIWLMHGIENGQWNDLPCSHLHMYACKGDQYSATYLSSAEETTTRIAEITSPILDTRKVPNYRLSLLGNFSSSSGQMFDPNCASQYSQSMYERADAMRSPVNSQLGGLLCPERQQEELLLASATSALTTDRDLGYVRLNYFLASLNHLTFDQVAACGLETSDHLQDHDNWGYPILGGISGCPFPEFEPDFVDGGFVWHCANTGYRQHIDTSKLVSTVADALLPGYQLELYGEFSSRGGEVISISCISQYSDDIEHRAIEMISVVNGLIESQQLCAGLNSVYVLTAGTSFFAQNTAGNTRVYYTLATRSGTLRFTEMFACADQVELFLSDHYNWGFPLLPQIPGCPYLEFNPPIFHPQEQSWYCFDAD